MRYIESVRIQNFQSYKDETVYFHPGHNLLVGTSDSGKSAILRAISFVLYNYPRSSTLIHNGETEARVTVKFSDGTIVTRIKGARNAYLAQDKNGKKYSFDKIDKQIPDEIEALLNNPPEDEFNGFISYADQFAPMFLVDLAPSDLPRSLSNLTGISMLEECAKQLMQAYKQHDKQIKIQEKDYVDLLNEYHSYDYIDECQNKLEKVNKSLENYNSLCNDLKDLEKFDISSDDSQSLDNIEKILSDIDSTLSKFQRIDFLINNLNDLKLFDLISFNYGDTDLSLISSIIDKINNVQIKIDIINNKIKSYQSVNEIETIYLEIKNSGNLYNSEYKKSQTQLEESSKELEEYKNWLIEQKIVCETCGSFRK
jgi:DNA repair protein SbcC/Rad50